MNGGVVDRIRLGWAALQEGDQPGKDELRTHHLDEPDGVATRLGLDSDGVPWMLIPAEDAGPEAEAGEVRVINRTLNAGDGDRRFVSVGCADPSLRGAFDHLLEAIIEVLAARPTDNPGALAVETLAEWRSLLLSRKPGLGPSALAALLAELLVLVDLAEYDPAFALASWTGPSKARHDFRRGPRAVEVKSTLAHTKRQATIHGVDQLLPPDSGVLHLAWHRLEVVPDGRLSVFSVADRLIGMGASALELHGLLDESGSPPSLRDAHEAVRFELRERCWFAVDEGFPRIIPSLFVDGSVPDDVLEVTYQVALPSDDVALGEQEWRSVVVEFMAGEA